MKNLKIVIKLTNTVHPDRIQGGNDDNQTLTTVKRIGVWGNTSHLMHRTALQASQTGAVLIISLIMLLLLTLIGMTGSQVTSMEEKMAGNSRNHNLAFQAAESALRAAETATATRVSTNYYTRTNQTVPIDWSNNKVNPYADGTLEGVAHVPEFIIESMTSTAGGQDDCSPCEMGPGGSSKSVSWYRLTARGMGGTANSIVTLQSIYKRE